MIVVETPSTATQPPFRVAVIGSCRVHMPVAVLGQAGQLKICDRGLSGTHTAAEAAQSLSQVLGDLAVPDFLSPYVFSEDVTPPTDRLRRVLEDGIDACIVEVSDSRQFRIGDILLQQNFVSVNLIQPHRGALLAWYREVCNRGAASEATVEAALVKLEAGGYRHDEAMAELLSGVRLERPDAGQIQAAIEAMMARLPARWIIVGPFELKDDEGAIMRDRRELIANIAAAARGAGAEFYDPSHLIEEHGRATVLDGDGANIFEYAPTFYPTVGENLVRVVRQSQPASAPIAATTTPSGLPSAELALRVNRELVELHHRRVSELGIDRSGLYAHYANHLNRGAIIGPREQTVLELVAGHLPNYPSYAVMRAGIGELALLIAATGRVTIAYEPDRFRRDAIEAGAAHLEEAGLIAPGAFTLFDGVAPDGGHQPVGALGLGLDAVHSRDEQIARELLKRLAVFPSLLIDPRMLFKLRESQEDQAALAASLADMGFRHRRLYPGDGLAWFSRREATAQGDAMSAASDGSRTWWRALARTG